MQIVPYANITENSDMTLNTKLRWKARVKKKRVELYYTYYKIYFMYYIKYTYYVYYKI